LAPTLAEAVALLQVCTLLDVILSNRTTQFYSF